MLAYTLRRTLWAIPTILAVITACYLLLHLTPGGPFDTDKQLSAAVLANLNAKYRLDEPLWLQYLHYLGSLLHGDLGPSFRYADWSVNDLVWKALPVSLGVGGVSVPIALVIGVTLRRSVLMTRIGSVLPPPMVKLVRMKSSMESATAIKAAPITIGRITGKVMSKKARKGEAPRSRAASTVRKSKEARRA